ncbi:HAD family hydrolase [Allofranklinella schreckenbergeri]
MPETPSARPMMRPLKQWPLAQRNAIQGVMTDIDDTLTRDGHIVPSALDALHALRACGLRLIAITGRPAGWSAPYAEQWPLDALLAENGAVAFVRQSDGRMAKLYQQSAQVRAHNFARMQALAQHITATVPGAQLATDSPGRECDIAIDHSEFTQLPQEHIAHVVRLMQEAGMHATVSSIHINGWFGEHNKWQGAQWIVRQLWGRALPDELTQWVYIGDSTNDETMFAHCTHSVGVANIARFAPAMRHLPVYVAEAERGDGFAEMAALLLAAQSAPATAPSPACSISH